MRLLDQLAQRFAPPKLTRGRVAAALLVAVFADGLQILLGPLGWTFADEVIDVAAMALTSLLLGFHLLLLPTFVVEFIPLVDMLPTWSACVAAVIVLRKREAANSSVAASPTIVKVSPPASPAPQFQKAMTDSSAKPK